MSVFEEFVAMGTFNLWDFVCRRNKVFLNLTNNHCIQIEF